MIQASDVTMPFYGDILIKNIPDQKSTRGALNSKTGFELFSERILAEMSSYDLPDLIKSGERGKGIHKKSLKVAARIVETVSPLRGTIALRFLKQAYSYLMHQNCMSAVDEVVRPHLSSQEPLMIISHSLGTIVSYRMMLELQKSGKLGSVPLFVTMGSPLSLKLVRSRIDLAPQPLPSVKKWLNVTDREDFIALGNSLDGNYFQMQIENDLSLENGYSDPHSFEKYISSSAVCKKLTDVLR